MKRMTLGLMVLAIAFTCYAQKPDSVETKPPKVEEPAEKQDQPKAEDTKQEITQPEKEEIKPETEAGQPETETIQLQPEAEPAPPQAEAAKVPEPKIIYYQTTPEPKYETRYRSNTRSSRGDIKTLAGSMHHSGGFGALSFRTTDFMDETMVLAGIRGGWIINRTLGIGVEGHGIIPTAKYANIDPNGEVFAVGGYGGMFLELIFLSNTVVHVTFPTSAGAGWLGYTEDWESDDPTPGTDNSSSVIDDDVFWYVEPGANIEVNISRNFRMDFGVSKRFVQDLVLLQTDAKEFQNTNYYITLKIGGF